MHVRDRSGATRANLNPAGDAIEEETQMATLIQAIATYRPRIAHSRTMDLDELSEHLAVGTLVTAPLAQMLLRELGRQCLLQGRDGKKVRLPGVGLLTPDIHLDGTPFTQVRIDKALRAGMANAAAFRGHVTNREMIGVGLEAYKARWDAEHPGDPVVLPEGRVA